MLGLLVALVAAVVVATLTIDLGPALRKRAETAGSKYLERPMHIGGLKVELLTGTFEVDDLVQAIRGHEVIIPPNSPSAGVMVAFIKVAGAPVELLQIDRTVRRDL